MKKVAMAVALLAMLSQAQSVELITTSAGSFGVGGAFNINVGLNHSLILGAGGILPFKGDQPEGAEVNSASLNWIMTGTAHSPKYVIYAKAGMLFYGKYYTGVVVDAQYDRKAIEYTALAGGYKFYTVETNKWLPYFGGEVGYKISNVLTTVNYSYSRGFGLGVSITL